MSSSPRLQVALPAVIMFVFGLAFGLVAGRILWAGPAGHQHGEGEEIARMGEPPPEQSGGMDDASGMPTEADLRRLLASHEELLKQKPEDPDLARTVGNYHSMLGENDIALDYYAKAKDYAAKAGDQAKVTDIMTDEGVALVEKGDIPGGLKVLEEASARDAKDVRSRLTRVAVYMERAIASPPPGWDRKKIVADAEAALTEVEALEPGNEYAIQYRATIDGIRQMMGRPRPGMGGAPAGAATP